MNDTLQASIDRLVAAPLPAPVAWIGGKPAAAASGRTIPSISPIDGGKLADLPACGAEDIDRAVAAARGAFESRRWAGLPPKERKRVLLRLADLMEAKKIELAVLETRDMGMPIALSLNFNVGAAIDCLRWYAEAIDKLYDEIAPTPENELALIQRVPLGVIGAIVPWNFPLMIGAWKLGPALAVGNSVVLKPAEDASLTLIRLAELAAEAGLPEGVLNVVPGLGAEAGQALGRHQDVDCLAFTGSGGVGRQLMIYSAESNLKRVSLECGGKTCNIVMADAPDLEAAATAAARAIFNNQGQICNAPGRLLVQRPLHDAVIECVAAIGRSLRIGSPLRLDRDFGPIVNARQCDKIRDAVNRAEAEGARLALDGRNAKGVPGGFYFGPTVAAGLTPKSELAQEEVFGPVLTVLPFDTLSEAIAIANGTRYGLGAAIWSRDVDTVLEAANRLVAGTVFVNSFGGAAIETPFGGFKESGFGRDRSLHALDNYADLRTVVIRRRPV